MPSGFCKHGTVWTRCKVCRQEYLEGEMERMLAGGRFKTDKNLAFKCNWLDSDYSRPCGPKGRKWNIHDAKHAWCTQDDNPCNQLEKGERKRVGKYPCYECRIFTKNEFGSGVISDRRPGKSIKAEDELVGKLALMTTRGPKDSEEDRVIFGFLRVVGHRMDERYGSTILTGDPDTSIKIPKRARLRFWDFYSNPRNPTKLWGYGLFRYIPDTTIETYLEAQLTKLNPKRYQHEYEVVAKLLEIWRENLRHV